MTKTHVKRLIEYNKNHGNSIKQEVLNAIKYFGNVTPHYIKTHYFDFRARLEVKQEYQRGEFITKIQDQRFFTSPEIEKRVKEKTVDKRTIHRKLAELTKEGLVENKGGSYSLTINAKADIKYFAREFGDLALISLMANFFPTINTQENISNLINIFRTELKSTIEGEKPKEKEARLFAMKNKTSLFENK